MMIEKRNLQSLQDRIRRSTLVQEHVIKSKEFRFSKLIGAYFAFGSEVKTELIIGQARALGKKLALPRVEGQRITFYEMSSGEYLVKGMFGTMEPLPYYPIDKIDFLVIPGIAFDKKGYRLGYGKGYYDRYLSEKRARFSIGLAYNSQLFESLPHCDHDEKLDAIATEDGIFYL
jgi:5-formyltetrahydrofolate cyclo-ligase